MQFVYLWQLILSNIEQKTEWISVVGYQVVWIATIAPPSSRNQLKLLLVMLVVMITELRSTQWLKKYLDLWNLVILIWIYPFNLPDFILELNWMEIICMNICVKFHKFCHFSCLLSNNCPRNCGFDSPESSLAIVIH